MGDQGSGIIGLILLVLCGAAFFVVRRFFPALATILLGVAGVAVLVVVILVVLVLYFAFGGSKKKKGEPAQKAAGKSAAPDASLEAIYAKGRRSLTELRMRSARVKNAEVRKMSQDICVSAEKILKTVQQKPENLTAVRQFLNYYLPTMGSILEKFVRLEESGVPTADITEKTIVHLQDISVAMQKQYENLFAGDLLDLSVEMEALTQACKRDGLLTEEDVTLKSGEKNITLTL